MKHLFNKVAQNETFHTFILFLILLNAVMLGLETVPQMADQFSSFFYSLYNITQIIFVGEILIRILAFTPDYKLFFKDSWNNFDFTIIAISFLPGIGSFALIARLLRVLRLLRIFSVSDQLRGFFDRLKEIFDEITHASIIVLVLSYIFIIIGYTLFNEHDPTNWGSFTQSLLSVFYLLLFQNIAAFVTPAMQHSKLNLIYFILFYFIFISLFISVLSAAIIQSIRDKK